MKKYLGMYIIRPDYTEEQIKATVEEVNAIFTTRGSNDVTLEDGWGMKEMAYEINDFKKGYYVKFFVEANADAVEEFNRFCNIKEAIIRHIIVKD